MCMCGMRRPRGIPIPGYIHDQFPDNVKDAFSTFDAGWKQQTNRPVKRDTMPPEVATTFQTIKQAEIPEHGTTTCEESCYVLGVEDNLID